MKRSGTRLIEHVGQAQQLSQHFHLVLLKYYAHFRNSWLLSLVITLLTIIENIKNIINVYIMPVWWRQESSPKYE